MKKLTKKLSFLVLLLLTIFVVAGCTNKETVNNIDEVYEDLFADVDLTAVVSDLQFPKSVNDVTITWSSNNSDVISNEGKVTRGTADVDVEITITLKQAEEEVIKKITIKVLKLEVNKIEQVFSNLFIGVDLTAVTNDLVFPTNVDGVLITYQSSNPGVLSNEGKVTRALADTDIFVGVRLVNGSEIVDKVLTVKVLKAPVNKIDVVFDGLFTGINLNEVVSDLSLPTEVDGVTIAWVSNNLEVVTNDGKITRFVEDKTVVLTLTLKNGNEEKIKTFNLKVLKDPAKIIDVVYNGLFSGANLNEVVNNLTFPGTVNGVTITYVSSNSAISDTGVVTQGAADVSGNITITLKYGDKSVEKTVNVIVIKAAPADYSIAQVLSATNGTSLTVRGVVIGLVGNSAYINDGLNGIYLYQVGTTIKVGDEIQLTGIKAEYKGLVQLTTIANLQVLESDVELPEVITIAGLSEIDEQATLYNISGLEVVDFDPIVKGNNIFIKVKDKDNNQMDIIISKYINEQIVFEIANKISPMNVGDKIDLVNIVSGYFDGYQLQLVSADGITSTPFEQKPIETTPIDSYKPDPKDMKFIDDELEYITRGITPNGTSNVLIIPVAFTDYTISEDDLAKLQKSLFGTSEETGWESVKTYYEKSSYGKFTFDGLILDTFQTGKESTYYASKLNGGEDADYEVIKAALEFYDDQVNYADYDNNDDGYIDGIYFIYATPVWYQGYNDTGTENDSDLWWAYVYQYYTDEIEKYDGVEANYYLWAGLDFMDEAFIYGETVEDDTFIGVNASTYIHETGHMLGLYDYYDYEQGIGPEGGLGGADMMDYTVGDHNPFSKIMLNWATPLVVSGITETVTLKTFESSGEVVLLSTGWNNSYFDEYFLIDYYSPTGLNEGHAGYNGLFTTGGIRIYHVNSQINPDQESNGELFLYDNSDTATKVLSPVEADNDNSIQLNQIAEDEDLFQVNDVFGKVTNYKLNSGQIVNFNVKVISITETEAVIEITFE